MKIDYIWTNGRTELVFIGEEALERAIAVYKTYGYGKVWKRIFDEDNFLESIELMLG